MLSMNELKGLKRPEREMAERAKTLAAKPDIVQPRAPTSWQEKKNRYKNSFGLQDAGFVERRALIIF